MRIFNRLLCSVLVTLILGSNLVFADDLLEALNGSGTDEILISRDELAQEVKRLIGKTTSEQNIFIQFINDKNYKKALFQWWNAFDKTNFKKSENGKALFAILLSKNGLKVVALEAAAGIQNFKKVSYKIQSYLKQEFPTSSQSWNYADISWNKAKKEFWGDVSYVKSVSYRANKIKSSDEIIELLKKSHLQSDQIFWLKWQLAVRLTLENKPERAAKVLSHILKAQKGPVSQDLLHMTAARILYEKGYLNPAINYYSKILKTSDYWFVAQEEMAWSYIRKGQPQDTLAVTQSLVNPLFENHVGSETYMLRALAQLKVCDYYGALETVKRFSKIYKPRFLKMKNISESHHVIEVDKFLGQLKKGKVNWKTMGEKSQFLPNFIYRDEVLFNLVKEQVALESEVKTVSGLYAQSLSGASATIGYQASVDELKKDINLRSQVAKSAALTRVRELAKIEANEIKQVLTKMHIIEAEVVQQISMASKALAEKVKATKAEVKTGTTGFKNKFAITFPLENEVWLDEISNYKVDIKKACQAKRK